MESEVFEVSFEYGKVGYEWNDGFCQPRAPEGFTMQDGDELTVTGDDYRITRYRKIEDEPSITT
jgi:hypothetical protein